MMTELSSQLKTEAIGLGLCQQWQGEWGEPDKGQLLDKYVRGIDFGIKHDWPSVEFMKQNFEDELMEKHGVYVDSHNEIKDKGGIYVINGNSDLSYISESFEVATLYVRHNSKVNFKCEKLSKTFIHIYDNTNITITQSDFAKVFVYVHSKDCNVTYVGDVIVRQKI